MTTPAEDTEQILEAAFNEAFSAPPSRRQSVLPTPKSPSPEEPTIESTPAPTESSPVTAPAEPTSASAAADEDAWKQEYEEQVKAWRAQSAEAREKAEKVREQWEAKRAAEREEAAKRNAADVSEPEPAAPIPGPPTAPSPPVVQAEKLESKEVGEKAEVKMEESTLVEHSDALSPSPADVRDLVSGEPQGHIASSILSQPDTIDGSQKWEEVNSPASSYPSISFPEQSATPPSQHRDQPQTRSQSAPAPQSVTPSVFDSSLSTRTRLKALASSLAINLFLPFVNGVMLGFGEIFAKNFVLSWLGWGATATTVGISQRSRFGKQAGFR